MKRILLFPFSLFTFLPFCAQTLPAFPGAEGFGMYATGGRGGSVYHVTRLNDSNLEGSLRYGVEQSGKRIIVFDVSGTIFLTKPLSIKSNKTILGQTAPGDGICVADYPVTIDGNNVIIRYMRFRLGNRHVDKHEGDGLGAMDHNNIIIDHCSVSWSIDECLSVYGGQNLTVQWCIVSQSLKNAGHSKGAHGYGGNWGGSGVTYHHNLIAHNESRTPRLGPRPGTQQDERMDMRNNVIYNWGGEGCYGGEGMNVNIVNNYYKPGPCTASSSTTTQRRIAKIGIRTTSYTKHGTTEANEWDVMWHKWGTFYVDGNYNSSYSDVTNDNWTYGIYNQITNDASVDYTYTDQVKNDMHLSLPINYNPVTTHSAKTAYNKVLDYAGCSLHRDELDNLIISDTRNGTATCTGSGNNSGIINTQEDVKASITGAYSPWPTLSTSGSPLSIDNESTIAANGYTNIENAANELVAEMIEAQNADGTLLSGQETYINNDPAEYNLSPATHTKEWSFANGFTITNENGKTYGAGSSCGLNGVKYSAGTQFTIQIPTDISVSKIDITGASNYPAANGTAYIAEVNGTTYTADQYVLPAKDSGSSTATHSFTFSTPVTGSLTFTPGGVQWIANITLYATGTTGISAVLNDKEKKINDPTVYDLMGRKVLDYYASTLPHALPKGIYIHQGRKFVVK